MPSNTTSATIRAWRFHGQTTGDRPCRMNAITEGPLQHNSYQSPMGWYMADSMVQQYD
ncbi:hypothetical protein NXY15_15220 [Bacteroides thetaiotaomicron]|nr:hypothetical protein NXY15_15220 [Bacteroides thetaiotaomicron]